MEKIQSQESSKVLSQLHLIHEVSLKLMQLMKTEKFPQEATDLIQRKFDYYHVSFWKVNPNNSATLVAQSGALDYREKLQPGFVLGSSVGIVGLVIDKKVPYLSNDISFDPNFTSLSLDSETKSELCVPVKSPDGKLLGTLNIESDQIDSFDRNDLWMMETIAHQVGMSLVNSQLYSEVTQFNQRLVKTVDEKTKELKDAHEKILQQQRFLRKENRALKTIMEHKSQESKIIGSSPAMHSILAMVDKIAPTHATVLLQGESGTGKELIAQRLHDQSERNGKPYVTINCGALQESLLESELFGHEKGAFTGAVSQKIGLAETADGGTLFLDEIGELSLGIQSKLLRFLQEGEIYRVGGKKPLRVNVRVISATNRDLEKEVKEGRFREDLFYRLNTITLRMPPLRKRKEDIPALINYFLTKGKVSSKKISEDAIQALSNYDWPGNIRELQNTIERINILAETNTIGLEDIPFNIRSPQHRGDLFEFHQEMTLSELEKRHILRTLDYHKNNKTRAANALGVTIKTLYNKLHSYGLMVDKK